ncbi:MAG: hypothetical protein GY859_35785, partial [Desulfobacterales bacterium]|nr:hypothetical protein [Desulfobacterales bacterium]
VTVGAPIRFIIWDADAREEIVFVTPRFLELSTGDPVSPPGFEEDGDYGLELTGARAATQSIPLSAGWNIIGYPSPVSQDAMYIAQPATDAGVLDKVKDEKGNRIINMMGSWTNRIGDMEIRLYYDTDNAGADGAPINDAAIQDDDETDSYEWDVSGIPDGAYYVYAVVDDGISEPLVVYSAGALTISAQTPDICMDPAGICGSCQGASQCYSTLQAGFTFAATDDDPATLVDVGPGEYNENITIPASMVVVMNEGTVVLGGD